MDSGYPPSSPSFFRTRSWVQAWIDTWGVHPGIQLIDLGGNQDPLETLYKTRVWLKGCIPARTLCLAGIGTGAIRTPRAEYIHMDELVKRFGSMNEMMKELGKIGWDQFILPDILLDSACHQQVHELSNLSGWSIHVEQNEPAYVIEEQSFKQYCAGLSPGVRRAYFHQRKKLESLGNLQKERWPLDQLELFIQILNQLHITRWGAACYSSDSARFIRQFSHQLEEEGGRIVLDVLSLNGDVISLLFDIIWQGTRYNLQSGYELSGYQGLSLGALHLGYGIEEAILEKQRYDCMVGQGKSTDYKRRIANRTPLLQTLILQKPPVAALRKLNTLISSRK